MVNADVYNMTLLEKQVWKKGEFVQSYFVQYFWKGKISYIVLSSSLTAQELQSNVSLV